MDFVVLQDYRAIYGEEMVSLKEGDVIVLDDEKAMWIERDSPGTLLIILEDDVIVQEEEIDASREMKPVQDRMMKGVKTRS